MDVVVNLIRGMHVVCVDVGWVAFCGARRLRASRVATVGLEVHEWWGEIESDDGGWNFAKQKSSVCFAAKKEILDDDCVWTEARSDQVTPAY